MMSSTDQPLLAASARRLCTPCRRRRRRQDDSGGRPPPTAAPSPASGGLDIGSPIQVRLVAPISPASHDQLRPGAVVTLVAVPMPDGSDTSSTSASSSPNFSVPTMTSRLPPQPPQQGVVNGNGPIGIKRADSRCTAAPPTPKQAFDIDLNTLRMCVPAHGVPGTVLRVEFDNWYVVTASIVPGWNRINPDGSDEWVKHKTAATVSTSSNDPDDPPDPEDEQHPR